ncbi:uncharacterized protein WCC33_012124 [Rhinophrynus dorsalis]
MSRVVKTYYDYYSATDSDDEYVDGDFDSDYYQENCSCDCCSCEECVHMEDLDMCLCCQDIPQMVAKTEDYDVSCITYHPAFENVVLNHFVLETAYCGYNPYDTSDFNNRRYRYTAYRQLVRWCWGYLGKNKRVPLPSCAIYKIRKTYPCGKN